MLGYSFPSWANILASIGHLPLPNVCLKGKSTGSLWRSWQWRIHYTRWVVEHIRYTSSSFINQSIAGSHRWWLIRRRRSNSSHGSGRGCVGSNLQQVRAFKRSFYFNTKLWSKLKDFMLLLCLMCTLDSSFLQFNVIHLKYPLFS